MVSMTWQLNRNIAQVKADGSHSPENDLCCSRCPLAENSEIKKQSEMHFCEDAAVLPMFAQTQHLHKSGRAAEPWLQQQLCFPKLAGFSEVPPARKCYFVVGNLASGDSAFYPGAAKNTALHFLLAG